MPKIIDEARSKILLTAKNRLLLYGYSELSLRSIAQECSIAVGTIYNYFKDKNTLIACVMMEDWVKALDKMDVCCQNAKTVSQGFVCIYQCLCEFASIYAGVWEQFLQAGGCSTEVNSRHYMLRSQISSRVETLLKNLGKQDVDLAPLLAETILSAALQPDIQPEQICTLAERLH